MSVSLYGSGQTVLQVVSATNTTQFSTTSATMVSTGISASITPSSTSSKILVRITCAINVGLGGAGIALGKNGSVIFNPSIADSVGPYYAYQSIRVPASLEYLDSPATTSSTTYTLFFSSRNGTTSAVNESAATNNNATTITLLEISGA
jgi:hypothetical protein